MFFLQGKCLVNFNIHSRCELLGSTPMMVPSKHKSDGFWSQSSAFSLALTGSLECRLRRDQEKVPRGPFGRRGCAACSLACLSSTSLRTEGYGGKLRNRNGAKLSTRQMFWLEIWPTKTEASLGLTRFAARAHSTTFSPLAGACTPGTERAPCCPTP